MSAQSILRLLTVVILLSVYYGWPRFFSGEEEIGSTAFQPGTITEVSLRYPEGDTLVFLRDRENRWALDGTRGVFADPGMMTRLLEGLATARTEPADEADFQAPGGGTRVELRAGGLLVHTLETGPRLEAFRRQQAVVNGDPVVLFFDVSAVLGEWVRDNPAGPGLWLNRVLHAADNDPLVEFQVTSPFADLRLTRDSDHDTWRESGGFRDREILQSGMEMLTGAYDLLLLERLPTDSELAREPLEAMRMEGRTQSGREFRLGLSGPLNRAGEKLLWMLHPVPSDPVVVSGRTAAAVTPRNARVFDRVEPLLPNGERAVAARYERNGRRVELIKEGRNWRMQRPRVPLPIFRPPPDPDNRNPLDMAEEYALRLGSTLPEQYLMRNSDTRNRMAETAFQDPEARLFVDLPGGRRVEWLFSKEIEATGLHLVSVDGRVSVITTRQMDGLVPAAERFFRPEDWKGVTPQW